MMTSKEKIARLEARNNELHHLLDDMAARSQRLHDRHVKILEQLESLEARNSELKGRVKELESRPKVYEETHPTNGYFHSRNRGELGYNFQLTMTAIHELLFMYGGNEREAETANLSIKAVQGIGITIGMALEAITGEPLYQREG